METEPQSKTNTVLNAGAILVGCVVIAGAILWSNAHPSAQKTATGNPAQPQAQAVDINKVNIAGEPFMGNPNAPVTIAYWFDYQCPFCKQNEETAMPQLITDYVNTGKVKIVFKDFEFLGPDSQSLGLTARAVWGVAPDKFYLWHKAVYDNQGKENTGWATQSAILSIATKVLGASNAGKVMQLAQTNAATYQKELDVDKAEGAAFGVQGTPSFIVGTQLLAGAEPYAIIKQAIDATLATKK